MHTVALLALLLMPNWGFLQDTRTKLEDYVVPPAITAPAVSNTITPASGLSAPFRLNSDAYTGSAKATYSIDLSSNTVLIEQNADTRLQIASLTKLMTAYVALKDTKDLAAIVTIPGFSLGAGDAVAGLIPGDQLTSGDLISAMLISSGSDAAQSVAIIDAGSEDAFVAKMNKAASSLGLTNTHFSNPVGWDNEGNYSTAKDIANLSRVLLGNEFFKNTVNTKSKAISVSSRTLLVRSTNNLLGANGFTGIKTGNTEGAGECLASLEVIDNHSILTVIVGSPNRFGETVSANTWTKGHFLW